MLPPVLATMQVNDRSRSRLASKNRRHDRIDVFDQLRHGPALGDEIGHLRVHEGECLCPVRYFGIRAGVRCGFDKDGFVGRGFARVDKGQDKATCRMEIRPRSRPGPPGRPRMRETQEPKGGFFVGRIGGRPIPCPAPRVARCPAREMGMCVASKSASHSPDDESRKKALAPTPRWGRWRSFRPQRQRADGGSPGGKLRPNNVDPGCAMAFQKSSASRAVSVREPVGCRLR